VSALFVCYVNVDKRHVMCMWQLILLTILCQEVLIFHISGSIRRKKALETENVLLFKLLLEMKIIWCARKDHLLQADYISLIFTETCDTLCDNNNDNDPDIHIPSLPAVPDDYNLARTKVVSEVLLSHKILPKIPNSILWCIFTCVEVLLVHLKR